MEADITKAKCVFCDIPKDRIVSEHQYFFVIRDAFPVTKLHSLIISNRHVSDYFELTDKEKTELQKILQSLKLDLEKSDSSIEGYNIGINVGEAAGQTVMHFHQHFIPRRDADTPNPRGGVRGVIPDKQSY